MANNSHIDLSPTTGPHSPTLEVHLLVPDLGPIARPPLVCPGPSQPLPN